MLCLSVYLLMVLVFLVVYIELVGFDGEMNMSVVVCVV